jgi:multicomponent Na+:H+ antiporter subunit B
MEETMNFRNNSQIIPRIIQLLYPFILLFGFYIILNGHKTPGGGFQGGAILSAVFITRYLAIPANDMKIDVLKTIEKLFFLVIVLLPVLYLFLRFNFRYPFLNEYYLIILNILIGIKVWSGLSIIFFRFVFYESR